MNILSFAAIVFCGLTSVIKRGLIAAALLVGLGLLAAAPAQAASVLTVGTPEALGFTAGGLVSEVLVTVKRGWTNSDRFGLEIIITGLNGGFEQHGQQIVLVSDTEIFSTDGDLADVIVSWIEDETPQQAGELYTVCVRVLFPNGPFGDFQCDDFGPFE